MDVESLNLVLDSLEGFAKKHLTSERLLAWDATHEFPEDVVRAMCGDELGIQLVFVPEAYGGLGGNAFDVYRVCEAMSAVDVGVATGVLATFLGSDPIHFGGTAAQKEHYLGRIAEEGILFAYGATEPAAGSDLGALRTKAARQVDADGAVAGYRITGAKQWISNGGFADVYTILADAPDGATWFIVERGAKGLSHGKPEDKHGIRASNTAAVILEEVEVAPDAVVGGVEGQGLIQAQMVFGFTRLMVAAFGLGAGWAAMDRAIPYSAERIQAGGPLSEKQGYTHKLIVPNVVRLEMARAYIEQTAEALDAADDGSRLNTEGAIAKYLASEAGDRAAADAIQALGGYGYTREYMVEKIKRDVRITTIYEGTSEIMEITISRDRWRAHLMSRGAHYHDLAGELEALDRAQPDLGAGVAALALHALAGVMDEAKTYRLTRQQHVLMRLGELVAWAEGAAAMARRAARAARDEWHEKADRRFDAPTLAVISRLAAREAAVKVAYDGLRWVGAATGASGVAALQQHLRLADVARAQEGLLTDMDLVSDVVYRRV